MVFSLYNPAIVYANLDVPPPVEQQLVRLYSQLWKAQRSLLGSLMFVSLVEKFQLKTIGRYYKFLFIVYPPP